MAAKTDWAPGNTVDATALNTLGTEVNTKGDALTGLTTSVDGEVALFSGTGGKTIKRATGTGLAKLTSGVQSTVTAPTGAVVGDTDTQALTNKSISGAANALTNIPLSAHATAAFAALNTVGIGQAVFIANGGTVPGGTPTYTIVIEMDP